MNKLFLSAIAIACYTSLAAQNFSLNDREYFERQDVGILVFSNNFNGGFNDEKNSGIEIIHHGVRTVPTSRSFPAMWLQACSSASPTTLRTSTTGPSFGDRTKAPLPATHNT